MELDPRLLSRSQFAFTVSSHIIRPCASENLIGHRNTGLFDRGRAVLQLKPLALRHRLATVERTSPRSSLRSADRLLWGILSRIVPIGETAPPTAAWSKQQMTEAFPWDTAPRRRNLRRDVAGTVERAESTEEDS